MSSISELAVVANKGRKNAVTSMSTLFRVVRDSMAVILLIITSSIYGVDMQITGRWMMLCSKGKRWHCGVSCGVFSNKNVSLSPCSVKVTERLTNSDSILLSVIDQPLGVSWMLPSGRRCLVNKCHSYCWPWLLWSKVEYAGIRSPWIWTLTLMAVSERLGAVSWGMAFVLIETKLVSKTK